MSRLLLYVLIGIGIAVFVLETIALLCGRNGTSLSVAFGVLGGIVGFVGRSMIGSKL